MKFVQVLCVCWVHVLVPAEVRLIIRHPEALGVVVVVLA